MPADRDLTILLTLRDRAPYTLRWMAYAERIRLPFKVLIADGGTDPEVPRMFADRGRYPNVDYEYVRFPEDAAYADYYAKIAEALGRVQTPYVVMADNDDFLVVRTLRECVEFLGGHPDYVACGGRCAIFWLDAPAGGGNGPPYGSSLQWKSSHDLQSIDGANAQARILQQAATNADSFYDVKRTAEARAEFAVVRDLCPDDLFLMENMVVLLCAIAGKTRRLGAFQIARQHNAPDSSGGEHQRRYGDWFGRMLVESWSRDFMCFLDATAAALSRVDGISMDDARERMRDAYRMAVAPALLSDLLEEPTVTASMSIWVALIRRLVRLPEGSLLRRFLRQVYRRARWISADAVHGTGIIADANPQTAPDFALIREFLKREP
jgi:glycosyltransferase domain-containing protein